MKRLKRVLSHRAVSASKCYHPFVIIGNVCEHFDAKKHVEMWYLRLLPRILSDFVDENPNSLDCILRCDR